MMGYQIGPFQIFTVYLIIDIAFCPWILYQVTKFEFCHPFLTQWISLSTMATMMLAFYNFFDHFKMKRKDQFYGAQCIRRIHLAEVLKFEENKVKFGKELKETNADEFHKMTKDKEEIKEKEEERLEQLNFVSLELNDDVISYTFSQYVVSQEYPRKL